MYMYSVVWILASKLKHSLHSLEISTKSSLPKCFLIIQRRLLYLFFFVVDAILTYCWDENQQLKLVHLKSAIRLLSSICPRVHCTYHWMHFGMEQDGEWVTRNNVLLSCTIVTITKFSIVIGSLRAYLSHNWRAITWVSNYRCPI